MGEQQKYFNIFINWINCFNTYLPQQTVYCKPVKQSPWKRLGSLPQRRVPKRALFKEGHEEDTDASGLSTNLSTVSTQRAMTATLNPLQFWIYRFRTVAIVASSHASHLLGYKQWFLNFVGRPLRKAWFKSRDPIPCEIWSLWIAFCNVQIDGSKDTYTKWIRPTFLGITWKTN